MTLYPWVCGAHGAVTGGDCARCDDELIALEPLSGVYGHCTACGAIETNLVKPTGIRDLTAIGEHPAYPTGYGCELCS